MTKKKETNILLVEDTEEHAVLITRALQRGKLNPRLAVARDGQEALDYLYHRGAFTDRKANPRPEVILLDLKLPRVSGLDVLHKIKNDKDLKDIYVVILTSSDEGKDIIQTYGDGAAGFLTKSVLFTKSSADMAVMLDTMVSMAYPRGAQEVTVPMAGTVRGGAYGMKTGKMT